jgi:hypothetical protein
VNVDDHIFRVRGGDHAVEVAFNCAHVDCWCADFAWVLNAVTADCQANAFLFFFVGFKGGNDADICCCSVGGLVRVFDLKHGVGAGWH